MPVAVSCPHCAAKFSVKDEYAGKRAKCPKCAEPLTIPGAAATPATPATPARPVVAGKPKPRDEEEEAPRGKRRRDEDEEDEPARPTRKRETSADRDDDEDDDRPKRKRRRDSADEDDPPKKKSALPLILGIVGGVLLVCGGGCATVWFGFIKPTADKVNAAITNAQKNSTEGKLTQANVAKIQTGMTLAQVNEVFGMGRPASDDDIMFSAPLAAPPESAQRWEAKRQLGQVYAWVDFPDRVLVAFGGDPTAGGTVVAVTAQVGGKASEPIKLPGGPPSQPGAKMQANVDKLRAGMTLAQVEGAMGKGKKANEFDVRITAGGLLDPSETEGRWLPKEKAGVVLNWEDFGDQTLVAFSSNPSSGGTVTGVLSRIGGKTAEPVKLPAGGPAPPPVGGGDETVITPEQLGEEFDLNANAAAKKYAGKKIKLVGRVTTTVGTGEYVWFQAGKQFGTAKSFTVKCNFDPGDRPPAKGLKLKDTAVVEGRVGLFRKEKDEAYVLTLSQCKVEK